MVKARHKDPSKGAETHMQGHTPGPSKGLILCQLVAAPKAKEEDTCNVPPHGVLRVEGDSARTRPLRTPSATIMEEGQTNHAPHRTRSTT